MPPRAKTTKKKGAESGKRYPLNMRTTFEMRQALETASKQSGRSLAHETELRIERSFQAEDVLAQVLGGAEFRNMAVQLAAAFSRGARNEAGLEGHPEWTAPELLISPQCYRAGMFDVIRDMLKAMPLAPVKSAEEIAEQAATLQDFFSMELRSELQRRGILTFDFGDGRGPVGSGFIPPTPKEGQQ